MENSTKDSLIERTTSMLRTVLEDLESPHSVLQAESSASTNTTGLQYVAPGPDEKDANVYFLPQKNSSELKFVLQFTVTFP